MSIIDKNIFEENKEFYKEYSHIDDDIEVSEEQCRRNDEIYDRAINLIAFLTNKEREDFNKDNYWKISLAIDTIAELLTELGETVYIPTIIEDENGNRSISDIF